MASRSSLFVNARVHLSGTRSAAAVVSHGIEYIATRLGADRSATPDDLRRAELSERMGLAGYYAERPGSTALFDADGAIPLRVARNRLREAGGAIVTLVISVRREEADELRLACKQDWERWCRRELAPALAAAMGVPESSVRWVAAEHENAIASKHIHVMAWSTEGFDSLMKKSDLERCRSMLTDAALAPAVRAELVVRDAARQRAVEAIRAIDTSGVSIDLPESGRISYEHLRRWHPETARAVDSAIHRLAENHPEVKESYKVYREFVVRCAELKGLTGEKRDRYVANAMRELDARRANALLRTVAPDRTEKAMEQRSHNPAPTTGPAATRRKEKQLRSEAAACMDPSALREAEKAVSTGKPIPMRCLEQCPTYLRSSRLAPIAVSSAVRKALSNPVGGNRKERDSTDEVASRTLRIVSRALLTASQAASHGGSVSQVSASVAKTIIKGILI